MTTIACVGGETRIGSTYVKLKGAAQYTYQVKAQMAQMAQTAQTAQTTQTAQTAQTAQTILHRFGGIYSTNRIFSF